MRRAIYYRRTEHDPWVRLAYVQSTPRAQVLMREHAAAHPVGRLCFGMFEHTPESIWSLNSLGKHVTFQQKPCKWFLSEQWKTIRMSGRKQWVKHNRSQLKLF